MLSVTKRATSDFIEEDREMEKDLFSGKLNGRVVNETGCKSRVKARLLERINRGEVIRCMAIVPLLFILLPSCAAITTAGIMTEAVTTLYKAANSKEGSHVIQTITKQETTTRRNVPISLSVRDIQGLLARAGYNPGPADGILGPKTSRALHRFQTDHGLPTAYGPDQDTMVKLDEIAGHVRPKHLDTPTNYRNSNSNVTGLSVVKVGGTTVRTVGETLDGLGTQWGGSFIGGQMRLAGGIYKAIGTTIEGGADDMQSGKSISFGEANKRAANATAGAIRQWASDPNGSGE
jgi:peptidoglycan hydrolase-like protein with peptidoglycan-binding domain